MLSIPIPFVVSLLLGLLAVNLHLRFAEQAKSSCLFLLTCAITTAIVGLRWTLGWPLLQYVQPVMASLIPILAWYFFTKADTNRKTFHLFHVVPPLLVILALLVQPFWRAPLDELITIIYLGYGIALIRRSTKETLLVNVSFSHWDGVKRAKTIAGWMLLFSALIDTVMSLDFSLNNGKYSLYILTVGHLFLLPILSLAVVTVGIYTQPQPERVQIDETERNEVKEETANNQGVSAEDAQVILTALNDLMLSKHTYLDPDLTLSKLSRKLTIPAKQISIAVNLIHEKNISKLINEYRIEHAKQLIKTTDDSITMILMSSGFQTKSNFNREFSRVVGMTPSAYRKQSTNNMSD